TNDGELANHLTHPRYEVPRTYLAELRRPPAERDLRRMERGLELEDGTTAPARVRRLGEREIEITIREGRNRQVRRMVEAIDNEVERLLRVRFGSLELGGLAPGESRRLQPEEGERLWEDARSGSGPRGKKRPGTAGSSGSGPSAERCRWRRTHPRRSWPQPRS